MLQPFQPYKSLLPTSFKLEALPPTNAAARQHSFQAYLTVQQWKGNKLNPVEWGWRVKYNMIVMFQLKQINQWLRRAFLTLVSCGCKAGCGKACGCWNLELHCNVQSV